MHVHQLLCSPGKALKPLGVKSRLKQRQLGALDVGADMLRCRLRMPEKPSIMCNPRKACFDRGENATKHQGVRLAAGHEYRLVSGSPPARRCARTRKPIARGGFRLTRGLGAVMFAESSKTTSKTGEILATIQ